MTNRITKLHVLSQEGKSEKVFKKYEIMHCGKTNSPELVNAVSPRSSRNVL